MITIKLEAFEGPFDLLFHLIEKNKIDIYDIPIAELADQYIRHVQSLSHRDMESMSRFLYMTAALLEIKSKLLLPELSKEGEEPEEDPREALVARLVEYKRYKDIAEILRERESLGERFIYRQGARDPDLPTVWETVHSVSETLDGVTLDALHALFLNVLRHRELKVDKIRVGFDSVRRDHFTMEEKIGYIKNLLERRRSLSFLKIFGVFSDKMEKVVTFLALLELIKMKEIKVEQSSIFNDIMIMRYNEEKDE